MRLMLYFVLKRRIDIVAGARLSDAMDETRPQTGPMRHLLLSQELLFGGVRPRGFVEQKASPSVKWGLGMQIPEDLEEGILPFKVHTCLCILELSLCGPLGLCYGWLADRYVVKHQWQDNEKFQQRGRGRGAPCHDRWPTKVLAIGIYWQDLGTHGTSVPLRLFRGPLFPGDSVGNLCSLKGSGGGWKSRQRISSQVWENRLLSLGF